MVKCGIAAGTLGRLLSAGGEALPAFLDMCGKQGMLAREEQLGRGNGSAQAIRKPINHPSASIAGFLNAPHSGLPSCKALVARLIDVVRAENPGRLATFACSHTDGDISHEKMGIVAYNACPCWCSDLARRVLRHLSPFAMRH